MNKIKLKKLTKKDIKKRKANYDVFVEIKDKKKTKMSKIENIVYSAHDLNKRRELFKNVSSIKDKKPDMLLEDVYELAYQQIIKKKVISKEEDFSDWDVTLGDGLEDED
jgi:hypothetical protein|tara:strand:- start:1061 stop:1387 length:327 start_codon:yes stop_codon:yes gene_type:complete